MSQASRQQDVGRHWRRTRVMVPTADACAAPTKATLRSCGCAHTCGGGSSTSATTAAPASHMRARSLSRARALARLLARFVPP